MSNANKKPENGKAGLWDTRPNPFKEMVGGQASAHLGDVQGFGLACDKILASGCAFMLGRTRDGGAVVLTVLDGENRHRTYCATQAELERAIESIDFVYTSD